MAYNPPQPFDINSAFPTAQIIPVPNLTFPASAVTPYTLDLSQYYLTQQIGPQRSVYIDNSVNDATIIVLNPYTRQFILAPPRLVGWYPLLFQPPVRVELYAVVARSTITSVLVQLNFCNLLLELSPYAVDTTAPIINAANLNVSVVGPTAIVAGVVGQIIRVHSIDLVPSASVSMKLLSAATTLLGPMTNTSPISLPYQAKPYFSCAAGETLNLQLGAAVQIGGIIQYVQSA